MSQVTSPIPRYILPGSKLGLTADTVSGSRLLFDWIELGKGNTALRFVIVNTGSGAITVTPEAAYKDTGPAEVGPAAPSAFVVQPGQSYGDPYGMDEMRPWWRVWVQGDGSFEWGVLGIPRI